MTPTARYILAIAGVAGTVFGILLSIPSFMQERMGLGIAATFLLIAGLVLLAVSLGDADANL